MRRNRLVPAAIALAFAVAGCGDDFEEAVKIEPGGPGATVTPEPTLAPVGSKDLKDTKSKPLIDKPSGDPPSKLVTEEIVKGKGKAAKKGDTLSMQYVGVAWSTGEQFDASWDKGTPFSFELGTGSVIKGWDRGIVGLKVGGRRKLTIPPDLAYGQDGSPPAIGPDETLIFIVDLEKIE